MSDAETGQKRNYQPSSLDDLVGLDDRSLQQIGSSAYVSIPAAKKLGLIGNIEDIDASVSVRQTDTEIIVTARISLD